MSGKEYTVKDAIRFLNDEALHPKGFHAFFIRDDLISEDPAGTQAAFMSQTYDWRWGSKPDKAYYAVTLSAEDVEYIGKAFEIYAEAVNSRYIRPALERIVEKIGKIWKTEDEAGG